MREMKDSGVKTLGLIPSCWTTKKLKYVINSITTGLNPRNYFVLGDGDCFYVTIRNFRNGKILLDDNCDRITPEIKTLINKRSKLEKGNILFASISDEGRAYLIENSPDNWDINESVFSIKPQNNIDSRFLFYILTDYHFYKPLKINSTGSTFTSIKQDMLLNGTLVYPPIDEQKRIATYLDEQCRKIDEIMTDIQNQIDTLEDYKESVIFEVVTKGLDPDVEMQDSGIAFVKKIPAHWELHPVYYYFSEGKIKNTGCTENNLLSLSYGNIIRKDINTSEGLLPASFSTYNIVEKDDIIIRPTDLQNDKRSLRTGLVKEKGIITSAYIDLKPKTNVNSRFFHYLLHSYDVKKVFYNMGNGVRQGLNFDEFSKLSVFNPPIKEQEEIAEYLDSKCAEIDYIIEDKKTQLETIENYKKSMIYEYVTGKKEVPENE